MRVLLVTATELELEPLVARLTPSADSHSSDRLRGFTHGAHRVDVLTTGVGMIATATWCGRVLAGQAYDLAINLGVCGSFDPAYPPGSVVNVMADCIPELGAEDDEQFLTVHQLGLLGPDDPPFSGGRLVNPEASPNPVIAGLRAVTGITVNTVHGNERSIAGLMERFRLRPGGSLREPPSSAGQSVRFADRPGGQVKPDVESMEGAAFMYTCLVSGGRFAQVRAVSNMVEKRNRGAWKLQEAVAVLNDTGLRLIEHA